MLGMPRISDEQWQQITAEEQVRRAKERREMYALAALTVTKYQPADHTKASHEIAARWVAGDAVRIADALIEELDK